MNVPIGTPEPTLSQKPKPPEPIPTAWAESELHSAHNHRKSILDNCTECDKLSVELEEALQYAKDMEAQLTAIEALYNTSLIKLKQIMSK